MDKMVRKTRAQVEALKEEWLENPTWDLANTEEFGLFKKELQEFADKHNSDWLRMLEHGDRMLRSEAQELGLIGLYKMLLEQQEIIKQQERAIELLAGCKDSPVYRALKGMDIFNDGCVTEKNR